MTLKPLGHVDPLGLCSRLACLADGYIMLLVMVDGWRLKQ